MTGNKLIDTVIGALATLACAGTLGIFIYTQMLYKPTLPDNKIEKEKMLQSGKALDIGNPFKMEKQIINLPNVGQRLRFLEVEYYLMPFEGDTHELIESKQALIKDATLAIASKMSPNELNTVTGKILLESRLKNRFNEILGSKIVREVLFTRFVVQ